MFISCILMSQNCIRSGKSCKMYAISIQCFQVQMFLFYISILNNAICWECLSCNNVAPMTNFCLGFIVRTRSAQPTPQTCCTIYFYNILLNKTKDLNFIKNDVASRKTANFTTHYYDIYVKTASYINIKFWIHFCFQIK